MTNFYHSSETRIRGAKTLPGKYYTSPEIFAEEVVRIFYEQWLYVGREEQLANPGDYFLFEIGDESIIVVRDGRGQIQGHYNVCRHRGSRMCTEASGHFNKTIQCFYHAWTYGLDGRLIGVPNIDDFESLDKTEYPLKSVAVATWEGFVFINLSKTPEPFEKVFAPVLDRFRAWDMVNLRLASGIDYDVKANWKLLAENYSECYHCPLIHPELMELTDHESGDNDLAEGVFLGGYLDLFEEVQSMSLSGEAAPLTLGTLEGDDLNRVYYYVFFPNMLLSLHPDYVMAHRLIPRAANRTEIICEWFYDPAAMARPDFSAVDAVSFWDLTNKQDWHACEMEQLGLKSRSYTPGPYAGAESLLASFDQEVLRALGHAPAVAGGNGTVR